MNTADRSIKLLDAAIRRRFAFIELMPDSRPLKNASVGDLELDRFMDALNRRILQREGREKQIGQSYFLDKDGEPFTDEAAFAARFRRDVLPLLQEYAYDDYRELTRYLGKDLVDPDRQRVLLDPSQPTMFVAALANEYREEVEPEPEAEA
jgi:5-methylcytosine-specific restriction protein B